MTDVIVPYGDNPAETATLLLAAAEDLGLSPSIVRTVTEPEFHCPREVAEKAGLVEPEKPAEKTTAKKRAAAKKSTKKATGK